MANSERSPGLIRQQATERSPAPAEKEVPPFVTPVPGLYYLEPGTDKIRPDLIEKVEQIRQGQY